MILLTLNAGSSSLKYKLFDFSDRDAIETILDGQVDAIGQSTAKLKEKDQQGNKTSIEQSIPNHAVALGLIGDRVQALGLNIDGIAHRVVHGGEHFNKPVLVDDTVIAMLKNLISLAPLHNPANILGIETAIELFPHAKQVAVFDTGFHQTMPKVAYTYAIDQSVAKEHAIRRYGFHGTSYDYVSAEAAQLLNKQRNDCQMIVCHLGNGASACCIKNGQSIDTSMGFTPLAGLVMGTRSGDIDPSVLLYLLSHGYSQAKLDELLNKQSGLKGLCGTNDMREVESLAAEENESAQLALDYFIYRVQQYIGAYLTQLPECDAIVFTGGIGENAAEIRDSITKPLAHLGLGSTIQILVIETNEELQMAKNLYGLSCPH